MRIVNLYGKNGRNFVNKMMADHLATFSFDANTGFFRGRVSDDDGRVYEVTLNSEEVFRMVGAMPVLIAQERAGKGVDVAKLFSHLRTMLCRKERASG